MKNTVKETPRPIKELLELTLEELKKGGYSGLCMLISIMFVELDIITGEEWNILDRYFKKNNPSRRYKQNKNYWFAPYYKSGRITWLEKHIKLKR